MDEHRRAVIKGLFAAPIGAANACMQEPLSRVASLAGVRPGASVCEVLGTFAQFRSYIGAAKRIYLRTVPCGAAISRFYVLRETGKDIIDGAKSLGTAKDGLGRRWTPDPAPLVDIRRFGPVDSRDASRLLVRALQETGINVWVPPGFRLVTANAPLRSGATLVIDGVAELCKNAPAEAAVFVNASAENGDAHITIVGSGAINGAGENQIPEAKHELLRFTNCSAVTVDVARAGGNRFLSDRRGLTGGAINIIGGTDHAVSVGQLSNYGREGIWLRDVSHSTVQATETVGGNLSWSGVQVGGPNSTFNRIQGVIARNAGASGTGCDSRNSLVIDCISRDNAYFHGFNFGHARQPADGTAGLRLISVRAGTKGAGADDFNGLSVVNGSRGVTLLDCVTRSALRDGFNVSAGADDCLLERCDASGAGRYGLHVSQARRCAKLRFSGQSWRVFVARRAKAALICDSPARCNSAAKAPTTERLEADALKQGARNAT